MRQVPVDQPYNTSQSIPFGGADPAAKFGKHAGIDYGVPVGRDVFAPISGTVTDYVWGQYHGNVVQIFDGTNYPHMLHNSQLLVKPGDKVKEGQVVAKSGATGQGITGPHVHFGVGKKSLPTITNFNEFINPNEWLKQGGNDMFPNSGDLTNYYNRTGFPGHPPNPNDVAYWTTGTNNPNWSKGADHVWKDLIDKVTLYQMDNPPVPPAAKPLSKGLWEVK